ncbi:MAG: DUF6456 domain-containing protein [Pseudomonadota bacterium]
MMADLGDAYRVHFPTWVPTHIRHYLVHTECGLSIRALARQAGCHASTVMRQVRRNETRRDDPLVDRAFNRLAANALRQRNIPREDDQTMNIETSIQQKAWPDEARIDAEARRVLRRLAEPDAVLAVAPGMEKAVVVRETSDGRNTRTAVLDAEIAEAFALKDWIAGKAKGRVARYWITDAGRAACKRLLADEARPGFEEAPDPFAEQHRDYTDPPRQRSSRRTRYNANESPLLALARRKDKHGQPFLSPDLVTAGERLREDFELAQMGPRVTQNWDRFLTAGDHGSFGMPAPASGPQGARDRVAHALRDLGPGLGDVVMRCCCFLEGMEQAEQRMGWSARSGKIVLKIALQRLRRHYDSLGAAADMIG